MTVRGAGLGALLLVVSITLAAQPAQARKKRDDTPPVGTLIDNLAGVTADGNGGLERFDGLLIGPDGRILDVYHKGQKRPERVAYRLDAGGKFMVPGMIDAHAQVMAMGLAEMTLDLSAARSLDEALSRVAAYAAAHPDLPWILGTGWDEVSWGLSRFPTARELDAATGGKPAYITRVDGRAAWVNSAALAAAGISTTTADPRGGRIERIAGSKAPAGVLVESASDLVAMKVPPPRASDRDTAFAKAQLALLASGVTAVADMGTTIEDWQTLRRAGDLGNLRIRVVAYAAGTEAMALIGGPGPSPWLYDDRLRLAGVRLRLDGALGSRGAWLKQPYADAPDTTGLPTMNETQLGNLMSRAAIDRFQVAVDAVGDKANATALSAIDELSNTYGGDRRWRIEHAAIVDPADITRFRLHGVVASMQPPYSSSERATAGQRLGPQRLASSYPWKSIAATGARLAFGSPVPTRPGQPFVGMATATEGDPEQRLTVEQAFAAYTTGGAYAMFADDRLGRIARGYRADFLFVDRDPTQIPAAQLGEIRVLETWINGVQAWKAGASAVPEKAVTDNKPTPAITR